MLESFCSDAGELFINLLSIASEVTFLYICFIFYLISLFISYIDVQLIKLLTNDTDKLHKILTTKMCLNATNVTLNFCRMLYNP